MNNLVYFKQIMPPALTEKNALWLLGPLVVLGALAMDIYIPAIPEIQQQFQTSVFGIQSTLTVFIVILGVGQGTMGRLSDHYGRLRTSQYSLLLYMVGSLLCSISQNITLLLVARGLQALGAAGAFVNGIAMVRDTFSGHTSSKIYSRLSSIIGLAPISAPFIGATIQTYFGGWRMTFVFLTLLSVAFLLILSSKLPRHASIVTTPASVFSVMKRLLTDPIYLRFLLLGTIPITVLYLYCCISPHVIMQRFQCSSLFYGMLFGINGMAWVLSSYFNHHITYRLGNLQTSILGALIVIASAIAMLLVEWSDHLTLVGFVLLVIVMSLGVGLMMGPTRSGAMEPCQDISGQAAGFFSMVQFALPGLFGAIAIHSHIATVYPFLTPILLISCLALLGTWMLQRWRPLLNHPL